MKGIVLAGGLGTRLYPVTKAVSKQLLPIHDKPMIYYPVSILMLAGVREILLISTPRDLPLFERVLGDGSDWGVRFSFQEQQEPKGIADAFILGESFLDGEPCSLILGDNIFFGQGLPAVLRSAADAVRQQGGAQVFAYRVSDPERYGVIEFDASGAPVSLVEKPQSPRSPFAVTGLYFYDGDVSSYARELAPSARGEIEITDLNRRYLEQGRLGVQRLERGYAWLDTGTHDALSEAAGFVRAIEHRQGVKIACPEEIALEKGWIDVGQVERIGRSMAGTEYGQYLLNLGADRGNGSPYPR